MFTLAAGHVVLGQHRLRAADPRPARHRAGDSATAKALGITSAWYSPQVHGASYALGALDVSPLDMASAYGVFDNHGVRVPPTPVLLVEDPSGKVLIDNRTPTGTQVLDPAVADNVTNVLKGVITQPGATAYGTANIGRPAAGKTGTTSSYVDAWFVGYTPTLVTSVWMGKKNTEDPAKGASMNSVCSAGRHTCASPVFGGTLPADDVGRLHEAGDARACRRRTSTSRLRSHPSPTRSTRSCGRGSAPGRSGPRSYVGDGGPYVQAPPPPVATAPTTTSTTSTTIPPSIVVETTTTVPGGLGRSP